MLLWACHIYDHLSSIQFKLTFVIHERMGGITMNYMVIDLSMHPLAVNKNYITIIV